MELVATRNKGAEDILPPDTYVWQNTERFMARIAESYGFDEIRFPTFEKTELFVRSVGETTDVVQKEMWTVKGRESTYTLRPEGTAGAIRAVIQNGLLNEAMPRKIYYQISAFRHENVQKGRLWEFHQFGAELVGAAAPQADAQMISMANDILSGLGIGTELHINSVGCRECRRKYYEVLREFLLPVKDKLCDTCRSRFDKNPMRILDCKSEVCRELTANAPVITDHLCEECAGHFAQVRELLDEAGIVYKVDPKIVRGLDYYSRTVFEFISSDIGAQGTVCGGGRYDGLIEEMGGPATPALGFAMGMERLILALKAKGGADAKAKGCDLYILAADSERTGNSALKTAASLAAALRKSGKTAEYDLCSRSFKAQMKYANKINAAKLLVIGESELETGECVIKDMVSHEQRQCRLDGEEILRTL